MGVGWGGPVSVWGQYAKHEAEAAAGLGLAHVEQNVAAEVFGILPPGREITELGSWASSGFCRATTQVLWMHRS